MGLRDAAAGFLRANATGAPAAALYAQGRVKHVDPPLAALEDELCDFGLGGLSTGASPDRLDALVWAVTALATKGWEGPRIGCIDCDTLVRKRCGEKPLTPRFPFPSPRARRGYIIAEPVPFFDHRQVTRPSV